MIDTYLVVVEPDGTRVYAFFHESDANGFAKLWSVAVHRYSRNYFEVSI